MNVYMNNKWDGVWPVGAAAVVVAPDVETATRLLQATLDDEADFPQQVVSVDDMVLLDTHKQGIYILADGNY